MDLKLRIEVIVRLIKKVGWRGWLGQGRGEGSVGCEPRIEVIVKYKKESGVGDLSQELKLLSILK